MRIRITIVDGNTGLRTDLFIECDPANTVGDALGHVIRGHALSGDPTVDGVPLDLAAPVVDVLAEGMLVRWGSGSAPVRAPEPDLVVRVVSGASAGRRAGLPDHGVVEIGRSSAVALVVEDADVSRRHAAVTRRGAVVELTDLGSANGVFVDGVARPAAHTLREGQVIQLGGSRLVLESVPRRRAVLTRDGQGSLLLNRRFPDRRAPFTAPTVQLPTRPHEEDRRGLPVLAMLLPAALSIVMAIILRSPFYLIFGLASPLLMAGNWWTERRHRARSQERLSGTYGESLRAASARVEQAVADEDHDLHSRLPDPLTVVRTALDPSVDLWSRRPGEDGWLNLRFGTTDRPASVQVTGEKPADWQEPEVVRAPVGVDLEEAGVLGIAGPGGWVADRLTWVLVQCAVLHSPDELRMVVLAPHADEDEWGALRWLPHLRDPDGGVRAGWDDEGVSVQLAHLGAELDRRAESVGRQRRVVGGLLVVAVGSGHLLSRHPAMADLLQRGPDLGVRVVCTDTDDRRLPDRCGAVAVNDGQRSELRIDRGLAVTVVPDGVAEGDLERVARRLAPVQRVRERHGGGLPDSVRFTEVQPLPTAEQITATWSAEPERTAVVLGCDADGPAVVDIVTEGPHALVAGTTGAGKSELLQTWVAALALANAPERLSFVFVDFKGGAAFRDLARLPHAVGSVTNLNERLAARALVSLRAELDRRQLLLDRVGVGDRSSYLRQAALDGTLPAFPRLIVVVDELAELKERLPDLVDGLDGVARLGRSLGVHLILTTQKPAGVVAGQVVANADLRICLRTADPSESMGVIGTGGAAEIPKNRPGRALVGRLGSPRTIQTARVGTPAGAGATFVCRAVPLRWDEVVPLPSLSASAAPHTDLDDLVARLRDAADRRIAPLVPQPFSDPLPPVVVLSTLPVEPRAITLGLWDRPSRQRQEPLHVPLGTGHLGVVGSGRTGRTSALRAIAAGLALGASPAAVHVHAIDASGGLAGLTHLPHTGVVAGEDDPERIERLLNRLVALVRDRRRRMADAGAATIDELSGPPAQVVLLVDGWAGVTDATEAPASVALHELLGGGSVAAGVTVCLAGDERMLKARILGRLDHRLCMRLNNPSDATLLGLDIRNVPAGLDPGRGLWGPDGTEVQVPLLDADASGPAQAGALRAVAQTARNRWPEPPVEQAPMRLDPLPSRITFDAALALGSVPPTPGGVLLGVAGDRLGAEWVDLSDVPGHLVVAGPHRSGRSSALSAIAASAAVAGLPVALVSARPAPVHRAAADRGVTVLDPVSLTGTLAGFELLVIDDADTITWDDAVVARLTAPGAVRLAVAGALDSYGVGARGLLKAIRPAIGPVVLLSPPNHLAAENVGVRIERSAAFSGPPGRAFLSVGGRVVLGQVADVTG